MKYSMSATEILKDFGYTEPIGREWIDKFKKENNITLPKVYEDFMEIAYNCKMLGTSSIWIGKKSGMNLSPYFFFDTIEEMIEEYAEEWEEDLESAEEDVLYQFSKLPREQWAEKADDYLQIGSDFGAGIVTFGIKNSDLTETDPPVYMQHEADERTEWKKTYDSVSQFLYEEVMFALLCKDYSTAEDALGEKGFEYTDLNEDEECDIMEVLEEKGVDTEEIQKYKPLVVYDEEHWICVADEEKETFFVGYINEDEEVLYEISHS